MTDSVTVRLDDTVARQLARMSKWLGRSRREVVRDALRRQLALLPFEEVRRRIAHFAESAGYLTDEVFICAHLGRKNSKSCFAPTKVSRGRSHRSL